MCNSLDGDDLRRNSSSRHSLANGGRRIEKVKRRISMKLMTAKILHQIDVAPFSFSISRTESWVWAADARGFWMGARRVSGVGCRVSVTRTARPL
jgi:hypothetical protein